MKMKEIVKEVEKCPLVFEVIKITIKTLFKS
jgi:hypothetical protein